MTIEVINGKIRYKKENHEVGAKLTLDPKEEERLVGLGVAKLVEKTDNQKSDSDEKPLAIALDKKYTRELLVVAANEAEVAFEEKATKKVIIAAVIEQGKAEELLKDDEGGPNTKHPDA